MLGRILQICQSQYYLGLQHLEALKAKFLEHPQEVDLMLDLSKCYSSILQYSIWLLPPKEYMQHLKGEIFWIQMYLVKDFAFMKKYFSWWPGNQKLCISTIGSAANLSLILDERKNYNKLCQHLFKIEEEYYAHRDRYQRRKELNDSDCFLPDKIDYPIYCHSDRLGVNDYLTAIREKMEYIKSREGITHYDLYIKYAEQDESGFVDCAGELYLRMVDSMEKTGIPAFYNHFLVMMKLGQERGWIVPVDQWPASLYKKQFELLAFNWNDYDFLLEKAFKDALGDWTDENP